MKLAILLLAAAPLFAQQGPPSKKKPTGDGGPYHHVVLSASSEDGLTWRLDEGIRMKHASVPCAVVTDDGKVMLYFVDADRKSFETANVAVSEDGLTFEKLGLEIEGMPARKALDPAAMLLEDGMYVLYYFACQENPDAAGSHDVRRAVSDDGVHFEDKGAAFSKEMLVDPDVFWWKGTWYMYVFGRGNTLVATSKDGLEFTFHGPLSLKGWGTTAPIKAGDKLRLYAFDQRAREANEVHSFVSTDGLTWEEEDGARLTAGEGEQYTDPQVVRFRGGYKMYFKRSASPR